MTVFDASVVVDAMAIQGSHADPARAELFRTVTFDAPQVLLAEVASSMRSLVARGEIPAQGAIDAIGAATALAHTSHPIDELLPRVWELRHVLSVYDAWYVALAEALEVDLVTNDGRLQRAPWVRCTVRPPAAG